MTMEQPPPMSVRQLTQEDESNLRLLSIFHFVVGGLNAFGLVFVALHFLLMKFLMDKASTTPPATMAGPVPTGASAPAVTSPGVPDEVIMLLTVIYVIAGLAIGLLAAGNIMAGFWLKKQVRRGLTHAVAALNCACFPFGTVLGVFTFIVLNRPTVAMTYDANTRV